LFLLKKFLRKSNCASNQHLGRFSQGPAEVSVNTNSLRSSEKQCR